MATNTVRNVALEFSIEFEGAPLNFECQVIDASLSLPGVEAGDSTEVACPDGKVSEPGKATDGSISGNIFVDTKDTGITWALATLYQGGTEFPYTLTYYADQDATIAVTFTGRAKVGSFTLPFSKPGNAKQPIDLKLITAVMGRPTP